MIRIDLSSLIDRLNPICRQAVEEAASLCISQHCAEITVAHVLTKLVDQPLSDMRVWIDRKQPAFESPKLFARFRRR